ncbi:MAG: ComEC/Rec2 family competence protein [Sphingobium sp.]|nr:ComEC/Rec2 family competence protein [Sphingobium sp.]
MAFAALERGLEAEREQIGLWAPVALGAGIAAWFALPDRAGWLGFCCLALGIACAACLLPAGARSRHMLVTGGVMMALGCVLVWGKALMVGQPPLARPWFVQMTGEVGAVAAMPAQHMVRLMVRPLDRPDLPRLIRVNVGEGDVPVGLGRGAVIRFRARLMPPAPAAVPGGYDFARRAYFQGIGATGRALAPIEVMRPAPGGAESVRARLSAHIGTRLSGGAGGIAAALATGDQGAIPEADAEAMRRSGLAHLLSISGLHVTALIGAVMLLTLRLAALSSRAALHLPLMLIAAGVGALAGIGYTVLTGAEVPTVRSCVAALLVLGGMAMGRDAVTLRLVAAGALVVLAFWPESLVGPSFQMSFAAVVAIVALSSSRRHRELTMARDEGWPRKLARGIGALLLTGFAVEIVLAPIALYHFHQAGLLGAFANLIAIPLTTFIVMPFEALALLLDPLELGDPAWWVVGQALGLLLALAHRVAASPIAVMLAPAFPAWVFAALVIGGLWCLLWRGRWRWLGVAPLLMGMAAIVTTPPPDLLVTGDGRHVALRLPDGGMALLRARAGDYVRDVLSESAGYDGALSAIADLPQARCSADMCAATLDRAGRRWRLLVTRSRDLVDPAVLARDCALADIVVSDRWLPRSCRPRWLKIDRRMLARTGGVALTLSTGRINRVRAEGDAHPWLPPLKQQESGGASGKGT